ncbi:MAG: TolC family protein [Oligoflexia bacterium]|nr:TolC family protein [Oligoflexia bacterium]
MNHTLASIVSFVFIFSALTANADSRSAPAVPQLRLSEALAELGNNNPMLKAYSEEASSRRENIAPQAALEDPMLEIGLEDFSASGLNSRTEGAGEVLAVRQALPFPGKRAALKSAAGAEYEASQYDLAAKRLQLISEFKSKYSQLALEYASLDLIKSQLQLLRSLLDLARNNYALSKVPQVDVFTLQIEEASLLDRELQAQSAIEQLRAEANHFLGRESNPNWRPELLKAEDSVYPAVSAEALLARLLETNPDLRSVDRQIRALEAKERYSKLGKLPDFELSAAYKIKPRNDQDRGEDEVSAAIGITLPLWAPSKQDQLIKKSGADRRKSEALQVELRNELVHALHRTLTAINANRERLALIRTALRPLTEGAIISAQRAYGSGESALSAVLNLLRARYETELSYQKILAEQNSNIAELEKLLGGELERVES